MLRTRVLWQAMKPRAVSKLLMNQPAPVTWAILNLPARLPKRWKCVETVFDGALFERDDGLCARATGTGDSAGRRWWHLIVGYRDDRRAGPAELAQVQRLFFPPHAMVLAALPPYGLKEAQPGEDEQDRVVHMWWETDGFSPLPDPKTWLDEPWQDDR